MTTRFEVQSTLRTTPAGGGGALRRIPAVLALLAVGCLVAASAVATPIQRDIVVDGDTAEWKTAPDLTINPDQFSTDATTFPPDLDESQATGRDLATFAYSWDFTSLFLWVQRAGSASNKTYWWFYLDTENDGQMGSNDVLLLVTWQGNSGALTRTIYNYTPIRGGLGDPLACPATGVNSFADGWCPVAGIADGYDMPGGKVKGKSLADQVGGLPNGLEMETSIPWAELGGTGPVSVQFHISSSNGQNIPTQLDDNMDGPLGSGLSFINLVVSKAASKVTAYGNSIFTYTIDIVNSNSANDATNVIVTDDLPANLTFQSSSATQGSYDNSTGLWTIGTLIANGGSASLTITVKVDDITSSSTATNTATTTGHDQPDEDPSNNSASIDVDLLPGADLSVTKTVVVVSDGFTVSGNDKAIPGARIRYTITVTNSSASTSAEAVVVTDPVPTSSSYVGNSITVDGSAQGDLTGDGDGSDFNVTTSGAVTSDLGDVAPGSTVTVSFEIRVD